MNCEVFELLELGSAGDTILEKGSTDVDEIMEPLRLEAEILDE